jgi:hypothetical protein
MAVRQQSPEAYRAMGSTAASGLLNDFSVNLPRILEAIVDKVVVLRRFVFANRFDNDPYDEPKQRQRSEEER